MLSKIPVFINNISNNVANKTSNIVSTKYGNHYLRIIVMLGPAFFVPTIWEVWTANNIETFKTLTWPLMLLVHVASFVILSHNKSDWCVRLCTILWFLMTVTIVLAIIFR